MIYTETDINEVSINPLDTDQKARADALLSFLGLGEPGPDDLALEPNPFDDNAFDVDGGSYLVLTNTEADEKAAEYIEDSLWAFNASFIIEHSALPYEATEMVESFCADKCESANETIKAMIGDNLETFIEDAISADGRGHFMNTYDGEEGESGDYFIYRTN